MTHPSAFWPLAFVSHGNLPAQQRSEKRRKAPLKVIRSVLEVVCCGGTPQRSLCRRDTAPRQPRQRLLPHCSETPLTSLENENACKVCQASGEPFWHAVYCGVGSFGRYAEKETRAVHLQAAEDREVFLASQPQER